MFSRLFPKIAPAVGVALLSLPASAASVLLDVTTSTGVSGGGVGIGDIFAQAATATTFTANTDIFNAELGMQINCVECKGRVLLFNQALPDDDGFVPASALITAEYFDGSHLSNDILDLTGILNYNYRTASTLTLLAGQTYSLVLQMGSTTDTTNFGGNGSWLSTRYPTFDPTYVTPGETLYTRYTSTTNIANYDWQPIEGNPYGWTTQMMYQISGDAVPPTVGVVPLPASGVLLVAAFGALAGMRRRRR